MKAMLRNRNFYFMVLADALLVAASYLLAYGLRFEGAIPPEEWDNISQTLPWIIPAKIGVFYFFNLYRGMWRYTSLVDLVNVIKAGTVATALIMLGILLTTHFIGFPRSAFIIDWGITILLIGGARMVVRVVMTEQVSALLRFPVFARETSSKKLLIIGAGGGGEKVLREIRDNPGIHLEPVGFLDDAREKQGKMIHGVPVLGTIEDAAALPVDFDEILIAIPSARGSVMRRIVDACEKTGKKFRTLPSLGELIEGRVSVNAIREVTLEDLLGREEVNLDQDRIRRFISGKRILITGAGGSIGSELVRQIQRYAPAAVGLLDCSEYNLYRIDLDSRARAAGMEIQTFLADIRHPDALERVFAVFAPQIVFHAAAYKHVPMQELHPHEAVLTNIAGTQNVCKASVAGKVGHFILVSTDKAVRPTNVMGATKRAAEMLIQSLDERHPTRFLAVRFGNVIGSSGSVIPLFQEQIARGGPVTVTHPDVIRYFMSIPEAAQLILQAGTMGTGGEIFILDMGKPVRIVEIARDLIRLHGLEPERDIAIMFIGLRPGEKLYEELITEGEGIVPTDHRKIMVLRRPDGYGTPVEPLIEELAGIARSFDPGAIRRKLKTLVPEYNPDEEASAPTR